MQIGTIGLNHKSAPIAVREYFSAAIEALLQDPQWKGSSLVAFSTCNRSEVIFSSEDVSETHIELLSTFREHMSIPFEHHLYSYFGRDSFLHLARVVTGLDSALIGECEIQRQVKKAYEREKERRTLSREMHYIFQKSFKVAKSMRSRFTMERWGMDLPHIIWEVLHEERVERILFIGYSEINRKIMGYIAKKGVPFDVYTKAEGIPYPSLDTMPTLNLYDAVISGTMSYGYVLSEEHIQDAPRILLDLGVPRNIDPQLGYDGRVLLNIDELSAKVEKKKAQSATEIVMCGKSVEHLVDRHKTLYYINARPQIRKLHKVI